MLLLHYSTCRIARKVAFNDRYLKTEAVENNVIWVSSYAYVEDCVLVIGLRYLGSLLPSDEMRSRYCRIDLPRLRPPACVRCSPIQRMLHSSGVRAVVMFCGVLVTCRSRMFKSAETL